LNKNIEEIVIKKSFIAREMENAKNASPSVLMSAQENKSSQTASTLYNEELWKKYESQRAQFHNDKYSRTLLALKLTNNLAEGRDIEQ